MKVLGVLCAILVLFLTVSCSNEELEIVQNTNTKTETKSISSGNVESSTVVNLLISIDMDIDVLNEVKYSVEKSIYYGQDENSRFVDMINYSSSKISRSSKASLLIKMLNDKLNLLPINGMTNEDFFNGLINNNIQIYWPYSKNWDGETIPTITSKPEDESSWNYGYKRLKDINGSSYIDTVIVNAEYIKNNPVWIVNENSTNYNELPDFENNEFVKDGVFFYSEVGKDFLSMKESKSVNIPGQQSPVYIGTINALDDLEGGLAGGPEFRFKWGHCSSHFINSPSKGLVNTFSINLLIEEVGFEKQINYRILDNWIVNAETNYLLVFEQDGGANKTKDKYLTYNNFPNGKLEVKVSIPYEGNDDILFDQYLERNKVFSSDNKPFGEWKQYQGTLFWFTLPTE